MQVSPTASAQPSLVTHEVSGSSLPNPATPQNAPQDKLVSQIYEKQITELLEHAPCKNALERFYVTLQPTNAPAKNAADYVYKKLETLREKSQLFWPEELLETLLANPTQLANTLDELYVIGVLTLINTISSQSETVVEKINKKLCETAEKTPSTSDSEMIDICFHLAKEYGTTIANELKGKTCVLQVLPPPPSLSMIPPEVMSEVFADPDFFPQQFADHLQSPTVHMVRMHGKEPKEVPLIGFEGQIQGEMDVSFYQLKWEEKTP